jgi:hypothetical protein
MGGLSVNKGRNQGNPAIRLGHNHQQKERVSAKSRKQIHGGERGIRTPHFPTDNKGNPHDDAQIDSQFPVASSPELSQVVTAWAKLPAPLKAAILAIVKTAE